jgi:glycosyltransferase involved in cell wall biosynthesis
MAVADRVVFPSFHVLSEAIAEDLIEPHRAAVVRIGVDHSLTGPRIPKPGSGSPPPCAARALSAPEVILCLGSDLRHKNREFALRLLTELQRRHAWPGLLVFAGAHIPTGGSAAEESRLLERGLSLRDAVEDCGAVTEDEKEWLLSRAALVIYPTVSEGFGLVPFEAAAHDVPCLWAPGTSLSEVLPDSAAAIIPWDAGVAADRAVALIRDLEKRSANVAAVNKAAEELRWDAAAERLIEVYRVTCDEAAAPAGAAERGDGIMRSGLSEDALRLIGPDGALPRELERPLLALATHPRLGNPVFGAIKAGYRASFRLRRT